MDEKTLRRLEEAVSKAIKNEPSPPKRKHERNVILESWEERGASAIFMEIFRRPIGQKEFACWKALIVIHKVLREGHPKSLVDAHIRKNVFEAIKRQYHAYASEVGRLISSYASYLLAKIDFHNAHQDLDPSLSMEKFLEKNANSYSAAEPGKAFTLVTHLIDFQQAAMDFQKSMFAEKNLEDFHTAAFIPLVTETYNIYLLIVHLLRMLVKQSNNMDVFAFLVEKFYAQYIDLRSFYFAASNIRYVTAVIAVPTLPPEPPKFEVPPGAKLPPKKKPKTPRAEPEPEVEIEVPTPQPLSDLLGSWTSPAPVVQQQQPMTNVFNGFGDNPFFSAPPIQLAPQPKPVEKPKDPFADLLTMQPPAPQPQPAPAPAPEPKVIVRKEIRIQKEVPPEILARLQELEQRVAQLEAENARLRAENDSLKNQNGSLKRQVDTVAAEKQRVLEDQIALAAQQLAASMYKFDDPSFLGNQSAIAADLLEAAEKFRAAFADLVGSVKSNDGKQVVTSRDVADRLNGLLQNAKGFSQFLEDYNIKNDLLVNSRATGELSSDFVSGTAKELVGSVPQPDQMVFIDGQHKKLNSYLDAIIAAVNKSLEKETKDDGVDLEDMAERELMKAAAMIEDAARQLDAQNQKRMAARAAAGGNEELNVADSIMQAAMAITQATQSLVRAATEAQAERVAKGKANPAAAKYHKDPMWVEGLISAARAVAEATRQLVHAANEAFQGRVDEAALIAASKAVAQATAQLVAATRAKSTDPFGKTQTKLDNAAQAVTKATTLLVNAARRGQDAAEAEIIARSQNFAEGVKAEIDQQAKILRLEKELETARKQLFGMRKSKYDASRADAGAVSPREAMVSPREEPARERSQSKSTLDPQQLAQLKNRLTNAVGQVPGINYDAPPPVASPVPPKDDFFTSAPSPFAPSATALPTPPASSPQQPQKPLSSNNPFFM
eukprot:TRINITY_DN564_c0_g1_i1.p1 TRINITY_DN564_c0_g1~~TRINITY_DN564_c0_g1_i1.p1  ORF type:complete len:948 (-),score=309.27 TRINITY_DN564_c0_g1_i1:42-2885(-)